MKNRGLSILIKAALATFVLGALALSSSRANAAGWANCVVTGVYEFGGGQPTGSNNPPNLVQVGCSNQLPNVSGAAVFYIGLQTTGTLCLNGATSSCTTSNPNIVPPVEKQNRFVSLAQSALLSAKKFRVYLLDLACPGTGTTSTSNCRMATAWSLYAL